MMFQAQSRQRIFSTPYQIMLKEMRKSARSGNRKTTSRPQQIVGLLKTLGVPNQLLYARRRRPNASFWARSVDHLQVLERARQLYRRQITEVHPDKTGGCLERTKELNRTWFDIKKRFKKQGHELW